jgi:hypothetical protein
LRLDVSWHQNQLLISYQRDAESNLGFRLREREVCLAVKSKLGRLGKIHPGDRPFSFRVENPDQKLVDTIVADIKRLLGAITSRPLVPKQVQQLLGISTQERLRWTKDGRLVCSGHISFRKGRNITIATHPVDEISKLISHPEIIAAWRQNDLRQE